MSHRLIYIAIPAETTPRQIRGAIHRAMRAHSDQWDYWDRAQITEHDERTYARLSEIPPEHRDFDTLIDTGGEWWSGFMLRRNMLDNLPPDTWIAAVDSHI
jgi:murein tripeptide amidase MpaA